MEGLGKGGRALFYDIVGVTIVSMQWELLYWLGCRGCQILFELCVSARCQAAIATRKHSLQSIQ